MGSKEAEKKLRLRLIQAGAQIKGEFPSSHEVKLRDNHDKSTEFIFRGVTALEYCFVFPH